MTNANSMVLNAQWSSRPDDQRYLTLDSLHESVAARRRTSAVKDVALEHLRVLPGIASGELLLGAATGEEYGTLTHWAFGQLAARAHAPAGYLRTLPPELAAVDLQWSVEHLTDDDTKDAKVLTRANGSTFAAAVTSPTYGRIWDADVVGAIAQRIDPAIWKVPSASYAASDPKRATTLYASDRDVFVFMVNESAVIEVPGEGPKFRGFYAYNSETGNGKFGIATFLYDRVCDNRIIWGMAEFKEIAIRHTSGAPMRYLAEAVPQLRGYLEASPTGEAAVIKSAQERVIGKDRASVVDWLRTRRFTQAIAGKAYDGAEKEGIRNPRTLWGVVSGLTGAAHDIKHTDDRIDIERKASALLDLVAA